MNGWDWCVFSDHSESWQASRQCSCWATCQISKQYECFNNQSVAQGFARFHETFHEILKCPSLAASLTFSWYAAPVLLGEVHMATNNLLGELHVTAVFRERGIAHQAGKKHGYYLTLLLYSCVFRSTCHTGIEPQTWHQWQPFRRQSYLYMFNIKPGPRSLVHNQNE